MHLGWASEFLFLTGAQAPRPPLLFQGVRGTTVENSWARGYSSMYQRLALKEKEPEEDCHFPARVGRFLPPCRPVVWKGFGRPDPVWGRPAGSIRIAWSFLCIPVPEPPSRPIDSDSLGHPRSVFLNLSGWFLYMRKFENHWPYSEAGDSLRDSPWLELFATLRTWPPPLTTFCEMKGPASNRSFHGLHSASITG